MPPEFIATSPGREEPTVTEPVTQPSAPAARGGPAIPEGKALAARNATTHGSFAAVPVLPGVESAAEWAAHRAALAAGLAPAGPFEEALAERAALLLWRLRRVVRYETEMAALG